MKCFKTAQSPTRRVLKGGEKLFPDLCQNGFSAVFSLVGEPW